MNRTFLFFIILLSPLWATAQQLTGTVYDQKNEQPVAGVIVYLDGTSVYAITDGKGEFTLRPREIINTPLIFNHLSYERLVVEDPFKNEKYRIYLEEKTVQIAEIVVEREMFTRAQMMKAFRENFLGITPAGKSCSIQNEGDIRLWYSPSQKTLFAACDQPIQVHNKYLGYDVLFDLLDFRMTVADHRLTSGTTRMVGYYGTSVYIDLMPDNARIQRRRENTYRTSLPFFFKNLVEGTLARTDFIYRRLPKVQYPIRNEEDDWENLVTQMEEKRAANFFELTDTLSMKMFRLTTEPRKVLTPGLPETEVYEELQVHLKAGSTTLPSTLYFLTNMYMIDSYGNIGPVIKLNTSGYLGEKRLGDMLPFDFKLP